jgi:hypothetical protein
MADHRMHGNTSILCFVDIANTIYPYESYLIYAEWKRHVLSLFLNAC